MADYKGCVDAFDPIVGFGNAAKNLEICKGQLERIDEELGTRDGEGAGLLMRVISATNERVHTRDAVSDAQRADRRARRERRAAWPGALLGRDGCSASG